MDRKKNSTKHFSKTVNPIVANLKQQSIITAFYALMLLLFSANVQAQFTQGRIVALQIGTGSGALSSASTALFLKEFTTTGTAGISVTVPATGGTALTSSGSATSEGGISLSGDGEYIVIPGYNAAAGVASIAGTNSGTVPRAVGKVDYNGTYSLPFTTGGFNANNIRGAAGSGANYWATGANDGVRYLGSGPAGVVSSAPITNLRFLQAINGNLYYSTSSGTTRGIYQVGTGLPTGTGITATNIINTGGSSSNFGFAINPAGTIAYIADDAGGISRYNFSGTWTLAYVVNSTNSRGLCVDWTGANPVLYATTTTASANAIIKITDTGAGSAASTIATAATNTVFRGICLAPSVTGGVATKLTVTPVNGGVSPSRNTSFTVIVQSLDNLNNPTNVLATTSVTISKATGSGNLTGGTLTGNINPGSNSVTLTANYNVAESGVSITATRNSGDVLASGTGSTFTVLGETTQLSFVSFPSTGYANNSLSPFTVQAKRADNSLDVNYTGNVTLTLNTGTGTIGGTVTAACVGGIATFNDISFSASGNKTLLATSGSSTGTSSSVSISNVTLTEDILPQVMQGFNGTNNSRVPFAYRVTISGLNPSSTYRYINQVDTLISTSVNGAGNIIFRDPLFFYRSTSASLSSAGSYGEFITDAAGSYSGWFITEPTGNARFTPGKNVYMRIILNNGAGGTSAAIRLNTTNTVKVVNFGSGISDGSGLRGNSSASPRNFVFMYDNVNGTGRPVAGTFVELDGSDNIATPYIQFYSDDVNDINGAYGVIIPNNLPNGIRRIEQRDLTTGNIAGCPSTDADGVWQSGANTVNPNVGATPIVITSGDALLDPAPVYSTDPSSITSNALNNEICTGNQITLTVNGGNLNVGADWVWYEGGCGSGLSIGTGSSITLTPSVGSHTYFVRAEEPCNNTLCVQLTIFVSVPITASVVVPPIVNLPSFACNGTTVSNINVPAVVNATYYIWDAPTNTVFANGNSIDTNSTPSANITFGALFGANSGYYIGVQAGNGCGPTIRKVQWVRGTLSVPSFTGPSVICTGTGPQTYTITNVPVLVGAQNYTWTGPAGSTINGSPSPLSNTSATSISLDVSGVSGGFTSGNICVQANAACITTAPKCMAITRVPNNLGVVSGAASVCPATPGAINYTVPNPGVTGGTYNWVLPANTSGSSTSNSINITFNAGFTGGTLGVSYTNVCSQTSAVRTKSITIGSPTVPASITTPTTTGLCGISASFTAVPSQAGATFNWTFPTGSTPATATGTSAASTMPSSYTQGQVCVTASNACGTSSPARCITVKGIPATPGATTAPAPWCAPTGGIQFTGNTGNLGGIYNLNWVVVPASSVSNPIGANTNIYTVDWDVAGPASVNLTASNACGSTTRTLAVNVPGCVRMGDVAPEVTSTDYSLTVNPNPATTLINYSFTASANHTAEIILIDISGRVVMYNVINASEGNNTGTLDVNQLAKGIYTLQAKSIDGKSVVKVVVE